MALISIFLPYLYPSPTTFSLLLYTLQYSRVQDGDSSNRTNVVSKIQSMKSITTRKYSVVHTNINNSTKYLILVSKFQDLKKITSKRIESNETKLVGNPIQNEKKKKKLNPSPFYRVKFTFHNEPIRIIPFQIAGRDSQEQHSDHNRRDG